MDSVYELPRYHFLVEGEKGSGFRRFLPYITMEDLSDISIFISLFIVKMGSFLSSFRLLSSCISKC